MLSRFKALCVLGSKNYCYLLKGRESTYPCRSLEFPFWVKEKAIEQWCKEKVKRKWTI